MLLSDMSYAAMRRCVAMQGLTSPFVQWVQTDHAAGSSMHQTLAQLRKLTSGYWGMRELGCPRHGFVAWLLHGLLHVMVHAEARVNACLCRWASSVSMRSRYPEDAQYEAWVRPLVSCVPLQR